jgi:hypothetical protein
MLWVPVSTVLKEDDTAETADKFYRAYLPGLPTVLPKRGWARESNRLVELSSERFPGSSPVWIWEE